VTTALDLEPTRALGLLREMLRIRRFEEKSAELYTAQKIHGFLHLYIGEEAVAVGAMNALSPDDSIVSTYREHGHALARGVPADTIMAEMYGKANGCARGRGGSMHLFDVGKRFYGGYAIVGGGLPVAVGLALADKMQGKRRVTACFFGDGATDEGEFHESLNLAALWGLPVLFLCENNLYAMGTALARHSADVELTHAAQSHGIASDKVDGMDLLATLRVVERAAEAVRSGSGPRFVELCTYRFRAHSMYDAERYRTKDEVAQWKQRDPIVLWTERMRSAGMLNDADVSALEREVGQEITQAVAAAESGPWEAESELLRFVDSREQP